jgi:hypothetical protein
MQLKFILNIKKKNQSQIIFITNWICFKKILNEVLKVNNVYYKLI